MAGLFSPITWANGETPDNIPSADDLNTEWRDAFNFFLNNRPMALLHHTTGSFTVNLTETAVPFQTEVLKRGGMVHDNVTNNTRLQVPITGQYSGYSLLGLGTISSSLISRFQIRIRKNGSTVLVRPASMSPPTLNSFELHGTFTLDLVANDYIEMLVMGSGSTAPTSILGNNRPRLALWYVGDYQ